MDHLREYLPKDKHDFESVAVLKGLEREKITELIPNLLEWLRDMNWPIAAEIARLLLRYPEEVIPHLWMVLRSGDEIWKYWCLEYLVGELPRIHFLVFKEELERIANQPTRGEELEEVHSAARRVLEFFGTN
ncbi:DUF5071 domain-containing protein [Paenibacillus mucilaginosus]|uniref:DUF5071 domain-containing protein n=2 Tax=Paenibacillus mucilaginosus TaxID=61624 RepID=I0BQX5_9BACL|nr:DUF5071 domain-containing protein [Paenibacillus mucilaginosus]AEI44679.1 hypothetical protein KNP414_06155 [Paenibacillus mucilaginosus KNP414]AFH64772.1 hypothetical protein B2K_29420 [Paenibacillus mucilaginosus K02]MCG7215608.1 DUF5071 domain-containing protein [Paenibacillus mucilaginosus]WDM26236.1 DUF5071 domain-containing protein [Paenibacillus mucilaginosus]